MEGFGPHEIIANVLKELGVYAKLELINEDRGLFFPDFQFWRPDNYEGSYWRLNKLKQLFPSEKEGLDAYYEFYEKMMKLMALNRRLELSKGFKLAILKLKMLPSFLKVKKMMNWSASQLMDHFFKNLKLKLFLQVFWLIS